MIKMFCFALTAMMVVGCTMFRPPVRPAAPMEMPERYSLYTQNDPGPDLWWQAFGSSELDRLVKEALSADFDVRTAWARLKKADAVARQAGADLKPAVSYSGGGTKSWQQTNSDSSGTSHADSETYSVGLAAEYELDLWGRLASLRQSKILELKATHEDLEAAAITVAAKVVTAWIQILSVRRQISILDDQIAINRRLLKLQELRFMNGKAKALDISQQREAMAVAKAKLPLLQLEEQQHRNALAVLLGRAGAGNLSISQSTLPDLIPFPATGLPADLLAARPDVRAAGLRLQSADWQVSAAQADRLPAITLSADAAFSSDAIDLLFSNWVMKLVSSITGPLFDGGYRSAEVDRMRAMAEEYVTAYARTVAEAIQEVEDGMATETRQKEYVALLEDELRASRITLKDARLQYMNGQNNYLDYLTAWTSVQDLERQLVDEHATLIINRVTLYRALGGGWTRESLSGSIAQQHSAEMQSAIVVPTAATTAEYKTR